MVGLLRIFLSAVSVADPTTLNIYALSCPNGAFPTIRHNDIRDLTAELMSEVCHDVSTEPPLQPLSGESLSLRTANQDVSARLDIKASGFWGSRFEPTFFDVRIFNPYAPSNHCKPYRQHETSKRRQYEERVREVEHGNFSPLVFFNFWRHGCLHHCGLQAPGLPPIL